MTAITLTPTDVHHLSIGIVDPATQNAEPVPAGDTFSAVSSSPAIGATIDLDANGNQEVVINALTLPSAATMGQTVTVTDSAGDVAAVQAVDYPVPVTPVPGDIVLGVSNDATVTTQAAPTNPGP